MSEFLPFLTSGLSGGGKGGKGGSSGIGPNAAFGAEQASLNAGNFYSNAGLGTSSMATAARSFPWIAAGAAADTQNQNDLSTALTQLAGLQGQNNPSGGNTTNTPGGTGQPTGGDSGAGTPV
jgi:hypothetical protein